jgi:hypothetical protein
VKLLLDHLVNSKYWKEEIVTAAPAEILPTQQENVTV